LGADYTINYKINPDYSKLVLEYTDNKGANIILDPIGAQNVNYNIDSLALEGRWVNFGLMGGAIAKEFNFGKMIFKRPSLLFSTLRTQSDSYKADLMKDIGRLMPEFISGNLKPIVDKTFKMSEVSKAHEYMESNANIGKIILQNDL